jgi:hypothetical protein
MLGLFGVAGCSDFLKGGDLTTDPNNPVVSTNAQTFQGIEAEVWFLFGSDMPREFGILSQQLYGGQSQYASLQNAYTIDPNTTNGVHAGLYGGGGLVDIARLKAAATASGDSTFLGIAQVQEAMVMGTGADIFGDLVYKEALKNTPNPPLDNQLTVYDSVQTVLSAAIANLAVPLGGSNVGPGSADLVYGGDPALWTALAHTLKARFYMHTAEVRPAAYASALAEAKQGIKTDAGNFVGAFTSATNEQNFWFQFEIIAGRTGYVAPNPSFDSLLKARNDPRRTKYFTVDSKTDSATDFSATRLAPDYHQPYVTADENTLIWAEAAYRTGDFATALAKLNEERVKNGLSAEVVSGGNLLNEILLEEYINDFQLGIEAFNLYKRTCTPNLTPTVAGQKSPRRLFYDTSEQQTDTQIPPAGTPPNGFANANDPANATSDGTGQVCRGQ